MFKRLLCALCVSAVILHAQSSQTPKLTARTVKFFVTALGASCAQGELGFDSTGKLQVCDPANTWNAITSGADAVQVNSVNVAGTANFNDSTPGNPAGAVNVKWQMSGANISAYVQAASASETGAVNLTTQTLGAGVKTFIDNVTLDRPDNLSLDLTLDSGNTVEAQARILYRDRGTLKWAITKDAGGGFVILDDVNAVNRLVFDPGAASNATLRSVGSTSTIFFENNSVSYAKLLGGPASGETVLFIRYHNGFSEQFSRVTLDAADTCGSGFKCLRVPN